MFVISVKAIIYLLLYNLYDYTFNANWRFGKDWIYSSLKKSHFIVYYIQICVKIFDLVYFLLGSDVLQ